MYLYSTIYQKQVRIGSLKSPCDVSIFLCSEHGEPTVGWVDVVMSQQLTDSSSCDKISASSASNTLDPRELFIDEIFYPDRFTVSVILKALNVSILCLFRPVMPGRCWGTLTNTSAVMTACWKATQHLLSAMHSSSDSDWPVHSFVVHP